MHADVDRLLRILAPALLLTLACDAKEGPGSREASNAAPRTPDGGSTIEQPNSEVRPEPESVAIDVGTPSVGRDPAKLDVGTSTTDVETPEPATKTVKTGKAATTTPSVTPPRAELPRGPTCPSGTWCTDKAAAKKHAVKGAKFELGCPDALASRPPGSPGSDLTGFDPAKTKATRADGDADACCYGWFERCPGGRPLLDGNARPVVADLRPANRGGPSVTLHRHAAAAAAWLVDAQMEHASVASFGRVALELLALGAPPELVRGAHEAALDELRHTESCLQLARAYGADAFEPGALPVLPPRAADLVRFATDTFIEGCVGESTAALVMTRAASGVRDPSVREVIAGIAEDEARHAALAWKMVRWAIAAGGGAVLEGVRQAASAMRCVETSPAPSDATLLECGRLDGPRLAAARIDAWAGLIDPMLEELEELGQMT